MHGFRRPTIKLPGVTPSLTHERRALIACCICRANLTWPTLRKVIDALSPGDPCAMSSQVWRSRSGIPGATRSQMRTISHDQERATAEPTDIHLRSRRHDRPADKVRGGGRSRILGDAGQLLHDDSRAAPDSQTRTALEGSGATGPEYQSFAAHAAGLNRHNDWNAGRCYSACFSDVVRLRAGRDNDRDDRDASATTPRALAGPRHQGEAQIRFR